MAGAAGAGRGLALDHPVPRAARRRGPAAKTVHKLNVPDLPIELWLEVLSYLPRGFVWKMVGMNRALFELGMN